MGVATALETFIYDNEPFDPHSAKVWREQLTAVLNDFFKMPECLCQPPDDTLPLPLDGEPE